METSVACVNELNITESKKIKDALKGLPLYVYDKPLHVDQLKLIMRNMLKEIGRGPVFIDYLGLIHGDSYNRTRTDEVNETVRIIAETARHLDIPVLLVACRGPFDSPGRLKSIHPSLL